MPQAAPPVRYWHSKPTQAKSRPRNSLFACPCRKAFAIRRLGPFRSARGERCEHDERITPSGSAHRHTPAAEKAAGSPLDDIDDQTRPLPSYWMHAKDEETSKPDMFTFW